MNEINIKKIKHMSKSRQIKKILDLYDESFNYMLRQYKWCFASLPLEECDIRNVFLAKIPFFLSEFFAQDSYNLKVFMCIRLKKVIYEESRRHSGKKYKILNERANMADWKYQIKCINQDEDHSDLDFSVLNNFEMKVYLTIFEACRSTTNAATELGVTRYIIQRTLRQIIFKMKKQVQHSR